MLRQTFLWHSVIGFFLVVSAQHQQQQQVPQQQQQVPQQQQQVPQQHHQQVPQQQQQQHVPQQQQQQHVPQQQQPTVPPPPSAQQQQPHPQFGAKDEVGDQQHIKSHLENEIPTDESQMSNEQLQFHYFNMHDLNKDSKLDGVELIKAITHWHGDDGAPAPPKLDDNELEDMIDSILKDDDFNNDGYVDYGEFLKAQTGRA